MLKFLLFTLTLLMSCTALATEEPDHGTHEALRALVKGIELAINEERYGDLAPYFHRNMRVTTINQEFLASPAEIAGYFERWFGDGGYLKKLEIRLIPDALTEFYANKSVGIVQGVGHENYILSDTRSYEILTRWTATMILDNDGQWRILTLHIGTNFLDNPVLAEIENSLIYFTIGGAVAGMVLMGLVILVTRRKRKTV